MTQTFAIYPTARESLVRFIYTHESTFDCKKTDLILFVGLQTSEALFEELCSGKHGAVLQAQATVKDLHGTLPKFIGLTVVWYAPYTRLAVLGELTREECLNIIESQKNLINLLYEQRQRL